ncbi:Sna3p [Lachancea thermotolerans CBS 6340]|uniref:KLTH0F05214p n=1 Tax=Lachancea thermotolerans (strain ATCC 56472 / CBS 6340 / NRRL Y-8284) TaxID=559295 RepID=C5DKJ5_LACTC|nr:KLTH0F05214p [Lachancea thermotolerans CBS 6340]CAR23996.1 KLTH0F05214p [Lachancea thermotolerans CBS 6340]
MSEIYSFNKDDLILAVLAFFIPPLPVLIRRGLRKDFWINFLLCFFLGFPAMFHALYVIHKSSREHPLNRGDSETDLEAQAHLTAPEASKDSEQEEAREIDEVPPAYNQVPTGTPAAHAATDNKIQH